MKLIFLYGPPGVGKLTVANSLSKKTGYKVLHNHLTIEAARSLFTSGSKQYYAVLKKLRFDLLEIAAVNNIKGVITTYVYGAEVDNIEIRELLRRMAKLKVDVKFVQLLCTQQELERRIKEESRKKFTKIRHLKNLRHFMGQYDTKAKIPFVQNLSIETTNVSAPTTANRIIQYYKL